MTKSIADTFMEFSFPKFDFAKEVKGGQDVDANGIKMSAGYDAADLAHVQEKHNRPLETSLPK